MYEAVPDELKQLNQWVVWKYEQVPGKDKPTKVPYQLNGKRAASTNPEHWHSFEAVAGARGFDGIGFVLSGDDPYTVIDLDAQNDKTRAIYAAFPSYAERSPSGVGVHIWLRGNIGKGRKRRDVEVYSQERFVTVTGLATRNKAIQAHDEILATLVAELDALAKMPVQEAISRPSDEQDEQVIARILKSGQGDRYLELSNGSGTAGDGSGSAIDQALVNIIQMHTKDMDQIERIWLSTEQGQRPKTRTRPLYREYTIRKAFDRDMPEVNLSAWVLPPIEPPRKPGRPKAKAQSFSETLAQEINGAVLSEPEPLEQLPGLVGEIANYIYASAHRQVPTIALAGAFGIMAGICGRAYKVSNAGLNLYILSIADTGANKSAATKAISRIMAEVSTKMPAAQEFIVNGDFKSGAGLARIVSEQPSTVGLVGEISLRLAEMSDPSAPQHTKSERKMLLELYEASETGYRYNPRIAAMKDNTSKAVRSPSYSFLGDGTRDKFYDSLDVSMVSEGMVPRLVLFDYKGKHVRANPHPVLRPPSAIIDGVRFLADISLAQNALMNTDPYAVRNVRLSPEAETLAAQFALHCDKAVTLKHVGELWTRAYLSALKIAALIAVGVNADKPIIQHSHMAWACRHMQRQCTELTEKFMTSDVGLGSARQISEIQRQMTNIIHGSMSSHHVAKRNASVLEAGFVPTSLLRVACVARAAFRNTGNANRAFEETLRSLINDGTIRKSIPAENDVHGFRGEMVTFGHDE